MRLPTWIHLSRGQMRFQQHPQYLHLPTRRRLHQPHLLTDVSFKIFGAAVTAGCGICTSSAIPPILFSLIFPLNHKAPVLRLYRMESYYDRNGVKAWSTGVVPHFITVHRVTHIYVDMPTIPLA